MTDTSVGLVAARDARTTPLKIAYRIDEVVAASGLGRTTIYALISEGKLRSFRVAGRRLVHADDLRDFLADAREGSHCD